MAHVPPVQHNGFVQPRPSPDDAEYRPLRAPPTGPWSTYARVLAGRRHPSTALANNSAIPTGPGPQPLRGIPGFPAQQQQQNRNGPLGGGGGRLPNGKIGGMVADAQKSICCLTGLISGIVCLRKCIKLGVWGSHGWSARFAKSTIKTN